jgi:hypothetical protein
MKTLSGAAIGERAGRGEVNALSTDKFRHAFAISLSFFISMSGPQAIVTPFSRGRAAIPQGAEKSLVSTPLPVVVLKR